MAYVSQELKAKLLPGIKSVIPADWKWSLGVRNNSTLVLTIKQSPHDLLGIMRDSGVNLDPLTMYSSVNPYHTANQFKADVWVCSVMTAINEAMNVGNHDNSDAMTDYFDVGWYTEISIGRYGDPYIQVVKPSKWAKLATKKVNNVYDQKKPSKGALVPFLPKDFKWLSPGKKAAATKAAMKSYYGSTVL